MLVEVGAALVLGVMDLGGPGCVGAVLAVAPIHCDWPSGCRHGVGLGTPLPPVLVAASLLALGVLRGPGGPG